MALCRCGCTSVRTWWLASLQEDAERLIPVNTLGPAMRLHVDDDTAMCCRTPTPSCPVLSCPVQLQGVMYPLLQYATNLSNPEAEVLVEEALKCWGVALAGGWGCCGWALYYGLLGSVSPPCQLHPPHRHETRTCPPSTPTKHPCTVNTPAQSSRLWPRSWCPCCPTWPACCSEAVTTQPHSKSWRRTSCCRSGVALPGWF